jgi:hypothetical protein
MPVTLAASKPRPEHIGSPSSAERTIPRPEPRDQYGQLRRNRRLSAQCERRWRYGVSSRTALTFRYRRISRIIIWIDAANGTAKRAPSTPNSVLPNNTATMTTNGCTSTAWDWIRGWIRLFFDLLIDDGPDHPDDRCRREVHECCDDPNYDCGDRCTDKWYEVEEANEHGERNAEWNPQDQHHEVARDPGDHSLSDRPADIVADRCGDVVRHSPPSRGVMRRHGRSAASRHSRPRASMNAVSGW